ncbi:unnamed protein product [Ectocarpus sp. 6 AP-2014]
MPIDDCGGASADAAQKYVRDYHPGSFEPSVSSFEDKLKATVLADSATKWEHLPDPIDFPSHLRGTVKQALKAYPANGEHKEKATEVQKAFAEEDKKEKNRLRKRKQRKVRSLSRMIPFVLLRLRRYVEIHRLFPRATAVFCSVSSAAMWEINAVRSQNVVRSNHYCTAVCGVLYRSVCIKLSTASPFRFRFLCRCRSHCHSTERSTCETESSRSRAPDQATASRNGTSQDKYNSRTASRSAAINNIFVKLRAKHEIESEIIYWKIE